MGRSAIVAILSLLALPLPAHAQSDSDSDSALHHAAHEGNLAAVEHALGQGTDPNLLTSRGVTPLTLAIHGGHAAIVARLLDAGAVPAEAAAVVAHLPEHLVAPVRRVDGRLEAALPPLRAEGHDARGDGVATPAATVSNASDPKHPR